MLSEQEYDQIRNALERNLSPLATAAYAKRIKYDYMLDIGDDEKYIQLWYICHAQFMRAVEKTFIKLVEDAWDIEAKLEADRRKAKYAGRGRKKADAIAIDKDATVTEKIIGGLTFGTVEE